MAIAFGGITSARGSGASSQTTAFTTGGSDRVLYVAFNGYSTSINAHPTGVTYAGVALTKLLDRTFGGGFQYFSVWRLIAPATGSNNVIATLGGTVSDFDTIAMYYTGVDQTTSEGTPVHDSPASTTTPSVNVTVASGELLVGVVEIYNRTITVGAGQTQREYYAGGGGYDSHMTSDETGTGTVTHSYTLSSAGLAAIAAWAVKPSGGGGGGTASPYYLSYYSRLVNGVVD